MCACSDGSSHDPPHGPDGPDGPDGPQRPCSGPRQGFVILDEAWARRLGVRRSGGRYRILRRDLMERLAALQETHPERLARTAAWTRDGVVVELRSNQGVPCRPGEDGAVPCRTLAR